MLSEEAQETQNKVYRQQRFLDSRRFSRQAANEDVMHAMLAASDQVINYWRKQTKALANPVDDDALALLENLEDLTL